VSNFLLAFGIGLKLGLRPETMAEAALKLEPTEHRLELKKAGDYFIIDDAFNSNPVGAKNAVDMLAQFNTGKRYVVTPGMIELGVKEDEENYLFGQHIGKASLDGVFLVGKEKTKVIYEGIEQTSFDMDKVKVFDSLFHANDYLRKIIGTGDVVLYENDLPDSYNE
jgi:UDP-N-acetylmuramoyl-tripeptide--D-alanyl-D-alanine ligase